MSSGNKNTVHPSFRATLIIYVAFSFFSSSATIKTNMILVMQQHVIIILFEIDVGWVYDGSKGQRHTPSSPFFTMFQSTTLLCTALRSSRKNIPSAMLLS
jgi:hypothetical protein